MNRAAASTARTSPPGCWSWPDRRCPAPSCIRGIFPRAWPQPLKEHLYDAIIATYSLHHLTDDQKAPFLQGLLSLLRPGGGIYIGDVAFATRQELETCRAQAGDSWDMEEFYFVYDELKPSLPQLTFTKYSACSGLLELRT